MTALIVIVALFFLADAWYRARNAQDSLKKIAEAGDKKFAELDERIEDVESKISRSHRQ
jgi:hypothetical protein